LSFNPLITKVGEVGIFAFGGEEVGISAGDDEELGAEGGTAKFNVSKEETTVNKTHTTIKVEKAIKNDSLLNRQPLPPTLRGFLFPC
jgi:hypothetical protein